MHTLCPARGRTWSGTSRIVVTDRREGTHPRLADIEVWSTGDNIALGIIRRGGSFTESEGAPHRMVDGMLDTYWRASTWFPYRGPKPEDWAWVLIDLGATFWVDRYQFITFFPPGGSWWYSLLRGYIVEGSDGSRAPDGSPIWRQISPDWRKYSKHNPKRILLFEDDFPLQKLRYLTIRNYDITGRAAGTGEAGMLGELMLYGRGYVSEVELESPLIELGGEKNLSVIEWDADVPPGTKLEVQTRTGDELRQILHYYNKAGKEITPEQWARLIGVLRGPVDTVYVPAADWSGWSRVYERSGQVVTSPSPRKYMTIRVRMLSDDPEMCVELRSIRVRFTQPIARRILGEVVPSEDVELGRRQEFSFYVRPLFSVSSVRDPQGSSGYDEVMILGPPSCDMELDSLIFHSDPSELRAGYGHMLSEGELAKVVRRARRSYRRNELEVLAEGDSLWIKLPGPERPARDLPLIYTRVVREVEVDSSEYARLKPSERSSVRYAEVLGTREREVSWEYTKGRVRNISEEVLQEGPERVARGGAVRPSGEGPNEGEV